MKNLRILLYSHNGFGIGHFSKNASLARTFRVSFPQANIILASGGTLNPWTTSIIPERVEFIKIPSMRNKTATSGISPDKLTVPSENVINIRSEMMFNLVKTYKPHVFIVDHIPEGVDGELKKTLRFLKKSRKSKLFFNSVILGFRGFDSFYQSLNGFSMDHRARIRKRFSFINNYYDAIFIYSTYDLVNNELALPQAWIPAAIRKKMIYTGYLYPCREEELPSRKNLRKILNIGNKKLIVVATGGSPDGTEVLKTYIAIHNTLPRNIHTILFPSIFMPNHLIAFLQRKIRFTPRLQLGNNQQGKHSLKFIEYLKAADVFVGMAGYNTIAEVLQFCPSAVLVPRSIKWEVEQYVHVRELAKRKLVQMVEPDPLKREELADKITKALTRKFVPALDNFRIHLNGNKNVVEYIKGNINI